jgi:predicted deacylase
VARADELSFEHYHSQAQIKAYLQAATKAHPDLVSFHNLGKSLEGREIDYAIVTRGDPGGKPALYFNGTHHGDEWSSTEGILGLMDRLVTHAGDDKDIGAILDTYAVYLQPLVNPDGHQAQTREDSEGRDPNRDYSSPDRSDDESFEVPEIKLVKSLVDRIHPRAAAAYHSGIEEVLWSWGYTDKAATDSHKLAALGKACAVAMGMDRYLQSYDDYATEGEFIDYVYMKFGTLALTFEVSDEKTPDEAELAPIVERSVTGALALIENLKDMDEGRARKSLAGPAASYGHLGQAAWHGRRRLE